MASDPSGPDQGPVDGLFCGIWEGMLPDRPAEGPAPDCRVLSGLERYHCAEHWFWIGLSDDLTQRWDAIARLTEVIDADDGTNVLGLSRMHALRGQLKMAVMVEHGRFDVLTRMRADMIRVTELDPANPIIPSFLDSIDLVVAHNTGNAEAMAAMETRIWENVERCPLGNILSISGIALGLPMNTGWPTSIADALGEWDCTGVDFCTQNTWKAPYARAGLAYHFGETWARVGDRERAERYLTEALNEPGADHWPYRAFVEQSLSDLDGWLDDFAALADDESATALTYAGQTFGCVFCHTHEPPPYMIPNGRLGRATNLAPFDDGGPDAPGPTPPGSSAVPPTSGGPEPSGGEPEPSGGATAPPAPAGACDNEADIEIMGTTDIGGTVGSCATSCLFQGAACITSCVERDSGLTSACSACFGQVGQCTVDRCALQCTSPGSSGCQTCQANNCFPAFEACSGVEMPN